MQPEQVSATGDRCCSCSLLGVSLFCGLKSVSFTDPLSEAESLLSVGLSARSVGRHEDAERVAGRVGVDTKRLVLVVRAVEEEASAQRRCPFVLSAQLRCVGYGEVEVELLGDTSPWPSGSREVRNLLKGDTRATRGMLKDQPVGGIGLARGGKLVARAVCESEQRPVELGQAAWISRVQHDLTELRAHPGHLIHPILRANGYLIEGRRELMRAAESGSPPTGATPCTFPVADRLASTIGLARTHGPLISGPFPVVEQFNERDERGTVRILGPLA